MQTALAHLWDDLKAVHRANVMDNKKDDDGDRIQMDVEEGQTILFAKYAGTEIKLGERKVLIMKESDILGIVE